MCRMMRPGMCLSMVKQDRGMRMSTRTAQRTLHRPHTSISVYSSWLNKNIVRGNEALWKEKKCIAHDLTYFDFKTFPTVSKKKYYWDQCSFVDPDPDRVGSVSFCRIRIGFGHGLPIRIRQMRLGINSKHMSFIIFHDKFKMLSKILKIVSLTDGKEKYCKLSAL